MHRTDGIADGALYVSAVFFNSLHGIGHVTRVVQGVKDAEDIDSVLDGQLGEFVDDIIRVVLVAQDILAA